MRLTVYRIDKGSIGDHRIHFETRVRQVTTEFILKQEWGSRPQSTRVRQATTEHKSEADDHRAQEWGRRPQSTRVHEAGDHRIQEWGLLKWTEELKHHLRWPQNDFQRWRQDRKGWLLQNLWGPKLPLLSSFQTTIVPRLIAAPIHMPTGLIHYDNIIWSGG